MKSRRSKKKRKKAAARQPAPVAHDFLDYEFSEVEENQVVADLVPECEYELDHLPGWRVAKIILEAIFQEFSGASAKVAVGYIKRIGQGVSREAYATVVEIMNDDERTEHNAVVLLPQHSEYEEEINPSASRMRKEARLLRDLASFGLPFRIPRIFGLHDIAGWVCMAQTFERGIPLDLRFGKQLGVVPWAEVAETAAPIHRITPYDLPWLRVGYATRRHHALAAVRELDDLMEPEAIDARAWMMDHLPPAERSVLLHGDLLGQNILLGIGRPNAVIDWEFAKFGDPAYDFAIVTRGRRQPFQTSGGIASLLEAYALAGGVELQPSDIHLHEIALAARWYKAVLSQPQLGDPKSQLDLLRGVFRRASAGA